MTAESKDPAAALTQRLRNKARELGIPFQALLEYYAIFRFLYQLSRSPYRTLFILKGGLAFSGWGLDLRRPTRDIDFQASSENSEAKLLSMIRDICDQPHSADPLLFDTATIKAVPIIVHAEQPGVRIKLTARLARVQIPMQLDFSFANIITPGPLVMEYPDPIGQEKIKLQGYPPETAIAEKLEAMVKWGTATARLKDYYDIWLLSKNCSFAGQVLAQAIQATFVHRGTAIPLETPDSLSEAFAVQQQAPWDSFLAKFAAGSPELRNFPAVLADLREFVLPVLQATAAHAPFQKSWTPPAKWG
jgi:predicted nucleotidyltransferase component of viral defense system